MANLVEVSNFDAGIYQLETGDPVMGGPGGIANSQAQALANRTKWLNDSKAPLAGPVFTGNPTAPTPAQFDNDTSLATTEFVKRQGMQASALSVLVANTVLTAAHAGGTVLVSAAAATAQTMPAASAVPSGARIEVGNFSTGTATFSCAGADQFNLPNGASVPSLVLRYGDTAVYESNGVNSWHLVGGSVCLRYSTDFGASLTTSGYQKLPSGIMLQWGSVSLAAAPQTITFPVAFPSFVASVASSPSLATNSTCGVNVGATTTTGMTVYPNNNNTAAAFAATWLAIGY